MKKVVIIGIVIAVVLVLAFFAYRSFTKSYSPEATADYNKGELSVSVNYCRPYKKERKIFGGLVPYGEVWRTGANEATEITVNKKVKFAGKDLEAGTYTLFTIPEENSWTIILNSELGQWGAFNYAKEKDVLRVDVPVQTLNEEAEMFTVDFTEKGDTVNLLLYWDTVKVEVPITQ